MENQLDSVTEKPTCFLRLQGLAIVISQNTINIPKYFRVHGFLRLSVICVPGVGLRIFALMYITTIVSLTFHKNRLLVSILIVPFFNNV